MIKQRHLHKGMKPLHLVLTLFRTRGKSGSVLTKLRTFTFVQKRMYHSITVHVLSSTCVIKHGDSMPVLVVSATLHTLVYHCLPRKD